MDITRRKSKVKIARSKCKKIVKNIILNTSRSIMASKEKPKKGEVRYFGKTYASEPEFLKAHGVVHFSVSKRFRLTPIPTQEERKRYFLKKVQ